jgi:hypothetical protein
VLIVSGTLGNVNNQVASVIIAAQLADLKSVVVLADSDEKADAETLRIKNICGHQPLICRLYPKVLEKLYVTKCDPETISHMVDFEDRDQKYKFGFGIAHAICLLGGLIPTSNITILSLQESHSTLAELLHIPINSRTPRQKKLLCACVDNAWDMLVASVDMLVATVDEKSLTNTALDNFIKICDIFYLPDVDKIRTEAIDVLWNGVAPCIMTADASVGASASICTKVESVLRPTIPLPLTNLQLSGDNRTYGNDQPSLQPEISQSRINPWFDQIARGLALRLGRRQLGY